MADRLLTLAWRTTDHLVTRDHGGGMTVLQVRDVEAGEAYVWRQGRADVTLRRDGDAWAIECTAVGRLLGPRQVLYTALHQRADYAVWDVMARVIRMTRDEEQGLHAGCEAARWIKESGIVDEYDGLLI